MNAKWKENAMNGRWKDMNAHWNENGRNDRNERNERNERKMKGNEYKWKEHDRKLMQHERNMHANERNMKEHACKWMQNERNLKYCRSTWDQQNNSSIHFRACLGMDFGFMLDLAHADFHKTLVSDRPPKSDNHNKSNYSHAKDCDGRSYDYIPTRSLSYPHYPSFSHHSLLVWSPFFMVTSFVSQFYSCSISLMFPFYVHDLPIPFYVNWIIEVDWNERIMNIAFIYLQVHELCSLSLHKPYIYIYRSLSLVHIWTR